MTRTTRDAAVSERDSHSRLRSKRFEGRFVPYGKRLQKLLADITSPLCLVTCDSIRFSNSHIAYKRNANSKLRYPSGVNYYVCPWWWHGFL